MPGSAAAIPTHTSSGGPLAEGQADQDGQRRGAHTRDGSHDPHPSAGEAAVQERRTDAVEEARRDRPPEIGAGRVAADDEGEQEDCGGARGLGDQGHRPGTGALGRGPADEVGESVGERRDERQAHDHHQVTRTPTIQTAAARAPNTSSMRMLRPSARSASFVDGHAAACPTRAHSAR